MTDEARQPPAPWYVTLQVVAGALMAVVSAAVMFLPDGAHTGNWLTLGTGVLICAAGLRERAKWRQSTRDIEDETEASP